MEAVVNQALAPDTVRAVLSKHLITDGMPMVLDLAESRGVYLRDLRTGRSFVDFFGFFASNALGLNHPKMTGDEAFMRRLLEGALNKVTNSDVYTTHLARFVQTFDRVGIPETLPHTFFVAGGALAVENALKAAFDWKVRKNFRKGYRRERGHRVLHLDEAFHGRSGYTLSLTNTADPRKTQYFPKFDWPRILNPKIHFPLDEARQADLERREELALSQAKLHFHEHPDDIACIILEPIQGEGGDNHFRPAFLRRLRDLAHENDALLIFDEVQTGVGITGSFWAYQSLDVEPDLLAFGKKTQVCGFLAGKKLDEVEDNVFRVSSRINSTWGGNLVDMIRFDRILEIIEEDRLVDQAARTGTHLHDRLLGLADDLPAVTNVRGRGLMCAFDLPDVAYRDRVLKQAYENGVLLLGCGRHSIRFRMPLIITPEQIDEGLLLLRRAVEAAAP